MATSTHGPSDQQRKPDEALRENRQGSGKANRNEGDAASQAHRKEDEQRSDWEGMTPSPEQLQDEIDSRQQLPETD